MWWFGVGVVNGTKSGEEREAKVKSKGTPLGPSVMASVSKFSRGMTWPHENICTFSCHPTTSSPLVEVNIVVVGEVPPIALLVLLLLSANPNS